MIISEEDIYSRKFAQCDLDEDGKVTFGELSQLTKLVFPAGKMNILGNVDFLQYCPELTALYIGDTAVETIDLSNNPKLERVALPGAMFLKTIILAKGCNPQIEYPNNLKKVTLEFVSDPDDPNAIWTE